MAETLRDEILDHLCRSRDFLFVAVGLLGVLLLFTLVGFTVFEPGTSTYVLNAMNLVGLSVLIAVFGVLTLYCYRSERVYR